MRSRKPATILCLIVMALYSTYAVSAADVLSRLTHGDQYSLALGTVVSTSETALTFQVETVISGESLPAMISVKVPGASMETVKSGPGEYAVISLNQEARMYTVAWGIFEVSSLDIATLKIMEGPLPAGDLAAFQWYINSGGVENDFYFIGTTAYVRNPDGTSTQIYPPIEQPARQDSDLPGTSADSAGKEIQPGELDMTQPAGITPVSTPQYEFLIPGVIILIGACVYALLRRRETRTDE